jgi:photosystem II stability/assembly factor-like uncharacterized protein
MQRQRTKLWLLLGACLIGVPVSAIGARAAAGGVVRTSAPSWLGLFSVAIQPDGKILIVGSKGMLLVSSDHGKTWLQRTLTERKGSELFQDRDLYSIRFTADGKSGWIVGEEGTVLRTDDGGQTWTKQETGVVNNLFKISVVDAQNAVAVGADGIIIRTTDGGAHWQAVKSPILITIFDVAFTDRNTGFAVGEFSTILATADGGQSWKVTSGGNTGDFTIGPFFTLTFEDPQRGTAAGLSGDLLATADGGKTWQKQKLPDEIGTYVVVEDHASKNLWVGGLGGRMFVQGSGGRWRATPRATFHDLTDIAFAGNQGVAVGLNGTILLTNNAGEQWQVVQ